MYHKQTKKRENLDKCLKIDFRPKIINKMAVDYPGYVYGSLVAMGGIMGYAKRQDLLYKKTGAGSLNQ